MENIDYKNLDAWLVAGAVTGLLGLLGWCGYIAWRNWKKKK